MVYLIQIKIYRGVLQNGRGEWQLKFYPYEKGGGKRFSHAEGVGGGGAGRTSFGVVLAILKGAQIEGGGGAKGFGPAISPFFTPPSSPRN